LNRTALPEISIIIPNYNHALFLKQRIDSVLNQTYQDFEVILMDDCSTDNSLEILKDYSSHPKVSALLVNESNSGSPFLQWKKGIEHAKGKLIWIAESDDYSDSAFLSTMIALIRSDQKIKVAFCQSRIADSEGKSIKTNEFAFSNGTDSFHDWVLDGKEFCRDTLSRYNILLNASSVIFEKESYLEVGGINTSYRICSDWLLWWSMISRGNVGFISSPLNFYRVHPSNTSLNWIKELTVSYRFFIEHWPEIPGKNDYLKFLENKALDLHRYKVHQEAFAISSSIGFFTKLKIYFIYLFRPWRNKPV
jgi:glycosyltransferase involved in cell wall biosynthesis